MMLKETSEMMHNALYDAEIIKSIYEKIGQHE